MPRSVLDAMLDADAIAEEHGEQGVYSLGERVGVDMHDPEVSMTALSVAASLGLRLGVADDIAARDSKAIMASLSIIWAYAFLAGALWKQQEGE